MLMVFGGDACPCVEGLHTRVNKFVTIEVHRDAIGGWDSFRSFVDDVCGGCVGDINIVSRYFFSSSKSSWSLLQLHQLPRGNLP